MLTLYLRALGQLLRFEYYVSRGDFALVCTKVDRHPCFPARNLANRADQLCKAIDDLCIWYPKQILCLQRSAATACLLKHYGMGAQLVIGAQQMPFRAHAWVELEGRVVNDKPYVNEIYAVLDRH